MLFAAAHLLLGIFALLAPPSRAQSARLVQQLAAEAAEDRRRDAAARAQALAEAIARQG